MTITKIQLLEKSGGKSGRLDGARPHLERPTHGPSRPRAADPEDRARLLRSLDPLRLRAAAPAAHGAARATWRLMEAYGLTRATGADRARAGPADRARDRRLPLPEYLEVLKAANSGRPPPARRRFGLGPGDNPVFPGLWQAARLVAGGSLLAADLVARGEVDRAFHFAGGLHHAMPARASGFCYVNDAVLAILRLRERGLRVAYVDIDAHHGDGVQYAFYATPTC